MHSSQSLVHKGSTLVSISVPQKPFLCGLIHSRSAGRSQRLGGFGGCLFPGPFLQQIAALRQLSRSHLPPPRARRGASPHVSPKPRLLRWLGCKHRAWEGSKHCVCITLHCFRLKKKTKQLLQRGAFSPGKAHLAAQGRTKHQHSCSEGSPSAHPRRKDPDNGFRSARTAPAAAPSPRGAHLRSARSRR